jgi:hypothetical protein
MKYLSYVMLTSHEGDDFFSDLTDWVTHLSNTEDIPAVHAVSYGNNGEGPSQEYRYMKSG